MHQTKEKWWVVNIDGKEQLLSYRNPQKLERYLKKVLKTINVKVLREGILEDYNKFLSIS